MNQYERMINSLPYKAHLDGLVEKRINVRRIIKEFNNIDIASEKRDVLFRSICKKVGSNCFVEDNFHCDYGENIELGDNFFANCNLTILDVAKVTIGNNVFLGPNVTICTAGHPLHPLSRNSMYEYGIPITIGNNVWLGANVIVLPGVNIGDNVVIGAGAVVTKDVEPNTLNYGNPSRKIRYIIDKDRDYYFKDRKFDVTDY